MIKNLPRDHIFSGKFYDQLKFLAQIGLPALGALYFGLAGIWGLPSAEQVVGTIVVIDTFLGVLLGLSSSTYNNSDEKFDGDIVKKTTEEGDLIYTLELNKDPRDLSENDEVLFKVKGEPDA